MACGVLHTFNDDVVSFRRNFVHGACRWGQNCYYSHDLPVQKSSQICRHYLNGFCFYGDHCRYQHAVPAGGRPPGSRRGSEPVIRVTAGESSHQCRGLQPGLHTARHSTRRGSEPAIQILPGASSCNSCAISQPPAARVACGRRASAPVLPSFTLSGAYAERFSPQLEEEEEVEEDKENETPPRCSGNWVLAEEFVPQHFQQHHVNPLRHEDVSVSKPALPLRCACRETCACTCFKGAKSQIDLKDSQPGTKACSKSLKNTTENLAYERSKEMACGICMDTVYEKTHARERVFAILPHCNHTFCVTCIKKWRNSRGFTNKIIKACPECRVVSNYYIPHKFWVLDEQKQQLIDKFKAEKRKIRCKFFIQSNGRCPFKSECIYLHEFPEGYQPARHQTRRSAPPPLSFWEDYEDDDDDYDDDYVDNTLRLLGILSFSDSLFEHFAELQYDLLDSDLSDLNDD
uniref:RING-type E3 ubiquitin transferase n=1 Tax=Callorhinchus milii TaxID=7868 RepID=A0A4W3JU23_CALMI